MGKAGATCTRRLTYGNRRPFSVSITLSCADHEPVISVVPPL
jgi:hypothetical protein